MDLFLCIDNKGVVKLISWHNQNYLKLKKEAEHHKLSYVEKRQKDKNFGKMVKRVLKTKKKRKRNSRIL